MNIRNFITVLLLCSLVTSPATAVQVNPKGLGEVLIYPYYTVNNGLNTVYSVVNTTEDTKAVMVRFLEGDNGLEVITFNVYLSAYDVWTGVLVPSISTINGHIGEPSGTHITSDTSCAPFLNKAGQEFLPFTIEADSDIENFSLKRATEGHIEIIELATFDNATILAADHGIVGVPGNCAGITSDWGDDGIYNNFADEAEPSGGLIGTGSLINVAEGIAFPYDAIALQDFWQSDGMHTEPGSLEPSLNAAFPESSVLLSNGELATSEWQHGFQAVSAVLTQSIVMNEYALEPILDSKTEWVMSFPTKRFHTSGETELLPPFTSTWDGALSCDTVEYELFDRSSAEVPELPCGDPCVPDQYNPRMCKVSNVLEFSLTGSTDGNSRILGSDNKWDMYGIFDQQEPTGWGRLNMLDKQSVTPLSGPGFNGLPVTGFAVVQYTNAGAAQGLLAQYGAAFKHKGEVITLLE